MSAMSSAFTSSCSLPPVCCMSSQRSHGSPSPVCHRFHIVTDTQHVDFPCALVCHCIQNRLRLFGTNVALLFSKHLNCPLKHLSVPLNLHSSSRIVHVSAHTGHGSQNLHYLLGTHVALLPSNHLGYPAKRLSVPLNTHVESVRFLIDNVSIVVHKNASCCPVCTAISAHPFPRRPSSADTWAASLSPVNVVKLLFLGLCTHVHRLNFAVCDARLGQMMAQKESLFAHQPGAVLVSASSHTCPFHLCMPPLDFRCSVLSSLGSCTRCLSSPHSSCSSWSPRLLPCHVRQRELSAEHVQHAPTQCRPAHGHTRPCTLGLTSTARAGLCPFSILVLCCS
eukprot:jgi/Antlo1/1250/2421